MSTFLEAAAAVTVLLEWRFSGGEYAQNRGQWSAMGMDV